MKYAAYLVVVVVTCYIFPPKGMQSRGEVHLIHFTPSFVSTFPVQVFAYTCAQNVRCDMCSCSALLRSFRFQLFPIYNELKSNSQERMGIVISSSIGGACIIYEIVAVFGYLTFGSKVGANIMAMYPATSIFIACGQLAIVLLVLFSYPLQVHPCRNCLDKIVDAATPSRKPFVSNGAPSGEREPLIQQEEESTDPDHLLHESKETGLFRHIVLTSAVIVSGFAVAYFVSSLQLGMRTLYVSISGRLNPFAVLSFVGSTGSTTISFVLPGLFFAKLFQDDPKERSSVFLARCLTAYGCCIFVFWYATQSGNSNHANQALFSLGFNIYELGRHPV